MKYLLEYRFYRKYVIIATLEVELGRVSWLEGLSILPTTGPTLPVRPASHPRGRATCLSQACRSLAALMDSLWATS